METGAGMRLNSWREQFEVQKVLPGGEKMSVLVKWWRIIAPCLGVAASAFADGLFSWRNGVVFVRPLVDRTLSNASIDVSWDARMWRGCD